MKKLVFWCLALVALMAWLSATSVTYHATCANCLAQAHGSELSTLGLVIRKRLDVKPDSDYPAIPSDGPKTFHTIFGRGCTHQFKRGGMSRQTIGMIGCGSFADERAFAPRIKVVTALFALYQRIPDREQAMATYACIDSELKVDATLREALNYRAEESGETRLDELTYLLDLISTKDEWDTVNAHARGHYAGTMPLLDDLVILKSRLSDPNKDVHRTAALRLMKLDHPERWTQIAACLEDKEPEVIRQAVNWVISEHRLELFGKVLRLPHEYFYRESHAANIRDEDVMGLIESDDEVIATFCHEAIAANHRFHFLQPLLTHLNRRFSDARMSAIRELLAGPKVFDDKVDPWPDIKAFDGSEDDALAIVRLGTAAKVRDVRKHLFLNAFKALATMKDSKHWTLLYRTYLDSVSSFGLNPLHAAVMARGLSELDPQKTEALLMAELRLGDKEYQRQTCALAAMGLLASPSFLGTVHEFQRHLPPKSKDIHSQHIFYNPYYSQYLDYALHRCGGIHLQEVRRNEAGTYVIVPTQ